MRKIVHLPSINYEKWDTAAGGIDEVGARDEFSLLRDTLRAQLAPLGVIVGDILSYQSGTRCTGVMFECHSPEHGSSLYVLSGYCKSGDSFSTIAPDMRDYMGGSSDAQTRVRALRNNWASSASAPNPGLQLVYNPDVSVARVDMAYDDSARLTYSTGDYTAARSSAASYYQSASWATELVPSHCPFGTGNFSASDGYRQQAIGYDDEEGVWLFASNHSNSGQWGLAIFGPILESSDGDNIIGTAKIFGEETAVAARGISDSLIAPQVSAFDGSGTRRVYDITRTNTITRANYRTAGGKVNWRKLGVENGSGSSGTKGKIKPQYLVEIGPYRDGSLYRLPIAFPDRARPVVCVSESMAVWWERGARIGPSYGPVLDPLPTETS